MEKTSGQIDRERRLKKSEINIKDLTICHYCKSTGLGEDDKFCPKYLLQKESFMMRAIIYCH